MEECLRRLRGTNKESPYARLVLLPIPTSRDGVHVTGTEHTLCEAAEGVSEGTLVAGYGIPPLISRRITERGGAVYDAAEDEDFLVENAEITARGALGEILLMTERDASELSVGIVGYGRIGAALTRLLLFLGTGVRVYSRRIATRLELSAMGIEAVSSPTEDGAAGLDLLVNTAPAVLFTSEQMAALPRGLKIIDLASGVNFPASEAVVKLPSIPERSYPITAGGVYARYIGKVLFDGGEGR